MHSEARAFWVTAPGHGEIRSERLAEPSNDEILVRTVYSGVSRGTEVLVFNGRVPESEWARMRAPFQAGSFPAPVKYGYANVGIVETGPADLAGRFVFTLYPHQTRFVVPRFAASVLPAGVTPERAVLAANMETAINGLWDARPHVGDSVAIVGGGTVGCLVAWLASRVAGCRVTLVDIDPGRAAVALALGAGFSTPESAAQDQDVVIHASGTPDGLRTALGLAAFEASVVELSWFGNVDVTLPLGHAFHARRLSIVSSQVGTVAPSQRARWSTARRMALALDMLRDPTLEVLITGESPFESLPQTMAELAAGAGRVLCHRVVYT
jgi:2-desacetyl-2-hydroxyethyl bacteriochlorophyllide A dehydrogenase